jgi:hypothetical protein
MDEPMKHWKMGRGRLFPWLGAAILLLALSPMNAPSAYADHIVSMDVSQIENTGLRVTLEVELTIDGDCCNGAFSWITGDGGSASIPDGVVNGVYSGDASGETMLTESDVTLADSRSVVWERTGPNPIVIVLAYDYFDFGTYTVEWNDCCPQSIGTFSVSVEDEPVYVPECSDGINNDGDGSADWPLDAGCSDPDDDSEGPTPECSDGIDNDGDGAADFRNDLQCMTPYDESEGEGGELPPCGPPREEEEDPTQDAFLLAPEQKSIKIPLRRQDGCRKVEIHHAGPAYAVRIVFYDAAGKPVKTANGHDHKDIPKLRKSTPIFYPQDAISFTIENRDKTKNAAGAWYQLR